MERAVWAGLHGVVERVVVLLLQLRVGRRLQLRQIFLDLRLVSQSSLNHKYKKYPQIIACLFSQIHGNQASTELNRPEADGP